MSKFAETQQPASTGTQPTPQLFFETLNAYQRTEALKAAIELDVFTAIAERANTSEALARRCQTSERGMRILCDYLVVIGFLTKQESYYSLTPDSAVFLNRNSPAYVGTAVRFLASPSQTENFKNLAAAVRKGGAAIADEGVFAPEHPVWVEFARGMAPLMVLGAELIAGLLNADSGPPWKVLDIAAGHGLFGIALAKHNPNAEIVAVDWPNVLAVASENAQAAGVADRHRTIPGSAFAVDYGSGYDLALITNFLHAFDVATCDSLLQKVHAALKPGGRALALEFIPNEDRVSPPVAASFSLTMLANTHGGESYTFSELRRMFGNAGFSSSKLHELPPTFQRAVIAQR